MFQCAFGYVQQAQRDVARQRLGYCPQFDAGSLSAKQKVLQGAHS